MSLNVVVAFDREAAQVLARHQPGHPELANVAELEGAADAAEVAAGLRAAGHRAALLPLGQGAQKSLQALAEATPDLVFNLCDTLCGDGSQAPLVPTTLEALRIPYTGASAGGLALSKRKHHVKAELERDGLPTPRYQTLLAANEVASFTLALTPPVMVKPTHEHASVGIELGSVCFDEAEVRARAALLFSRLGGAVLVEEYVAGREVYVSVVGRPPKALGLMEFRFDLPAGRLPIRSFEHKWFGGDDLDAAPDPRWQAPVPARAPSVPFSGRLEELEALCARAFTLGGGRDWGRVDVRVDALSKVPFIIDVTPNTYLSESSPCAKAAAAAGLAYPEFVESIALSGLARGRS